MTDDIWLADLARALADIQPVSDDDLRVIARLLGFAGPQREDPESQPRQHSPVQDTGPEDRTDEEVLGDAQRSSMDAAPGRQAGDLPLLSPAGRRRTFKTTGWGVMALPRVTTSQLGTVPERDSLLPPRGAATILQALVAKTTPEGPLDVPAIVEVLARQQVPHRLPRHAWPTLRFGVEVLVDLGLPMRPFEGDQIQLVAQLRAVIGPQRTAVRYFANAPARGAGSGRRRTWRPYEPPERGTRVLVLSDFGLGAPAWYSHRGTPEEWRSFAADLRRRECDAVALLPLPTARWPRWLAALMPLVCWDRTATAGKVAAALRGW